uniref:Putative helicase n=2 Tax=viral metagenome TaxID=1070528 RepID=A0A6H1ZAX5_9ZZZZ
MTDIINYIGQKGIDYKTEGDEIIITCPCCHKPKLYINISSGVFHCFVCQAEHVNCEFSKGHISKLKEMWGDVVQIQSVADRVEPNRNQQDTNLTNLVNRYHYELFNNKNALRYLLKRGINEESINRFKLGFVRMHSQDWLSIPSEEGGIPKLIKYRKIPPYENETLDKYIREKDSKSILFNGDIIDSNEEVILTEGEIDAITLIQNGYENVVGITGGAGTLLSQWYDKLLLLQKIYLVLDQDIAGQNAARDVWATRLGVSRCWNIELPKECDVNKFFESHSKKEFDEFISKAKRFKVEGIIPLREAFYEMYRRSQDIENIQKYRLPWESVNNLLNGGFVAKRLTVVGGIPGVGKTSLGMQILYHFATEYKLPGLFFCLEMPEVSLAVKILQISKGLTESEIDPSDGVIFADEYEDLPLYFGYSKKITPDIFYNTMKEARNRYGIRIGVFDNLQRMVRSDKESDIGVASGIMKDIAMDLNIMLIVISQPRKMNSEDDPTYDVLKGSSAIPADADEVILMHRKRMLDAKVSGKGNFSPITKIIVDKSRFARGGRCNLFFEGELSRFREVKSEDILQNDAENNKGDTV